jgi:hypothetical protein
MRPQSGIRECVGKERLRKLMGHGCFLPVYITQWYSILGPCLFMLILQRARKAGQVMKTLNSVKALNTDPLQGRGLYKVIF